MEEGTSEYIKEIEVKQSCEILKEELLEEKLNNPKLTLSEPMCFPECADTCFPEDHKSSQTSVIADINYENGIYNDATSKEDLRKDPSKPSLLFDNLNVLTGSWREFHSKNQDFVKSNLFLRGCKWSPDGTCLLTNSNDATLRLFDLPLELYNCHNISKLNYAELEPSIKTKVRGQVYDFGWYPLMTSVTPDSCCFATTSFSAPVQLWDAFTGVLRCSYRGYNQQDELDAALSVLFHPSGDFLLCGYKDNVKIFHTNVPGRDFTTISTKGVCDQKGLVSCLAVNPEMPNLFAAGTYSKSVGLYSVDGHALCLLNGQSGGLTQLLFTPDGSKLLSAGRKDSEILCWDLRQLGRLLWVSRRPHITNQRLYMDLSSDGRYLLSGSSDGHVYVWDLNAASKDDFTTETNVLEHFTKWKAHNDCVNGLSVHRHIPLIATASGKRYIPNILDSSDDEESLVHEPCPGSVENCVKLWWAGTISLSSENI